MSKKKTQTVAVPVKHRSASFAEELKYNIAGDEMVNFTKKLAFGFLECATFPGERQVRETHVQHLYDEWLAGRFLWHHVILAQGKMGDEVYRLNGQHTCWMRVNIPENKEPLKNCEVRLITYKVRTMEDLRGLYTAFDRCAPRTSGHVGRVMLMDSAAGEAVPPSLIGKVLAGFKVYWIPDNQHYRMGTDEWIGLVSKNYPQLFNMVGRFLQIHYSENNFVKRAAVLGAMFATFEKAVKASDEFWSPVCNGIGLDAKHDARYQLRQWLLDHTQSLVMPGKKTSTEETHRICLHAWNRWRRDEMVERLIAPDERPKAR